MSGCDPWFDLKPGRVPVPAEHAPRLVQHSHEELEEVTVCEEDTTTAWISMDKENTMPVKQ